MNETSDLNSEPIVPTGCFGDTPYYVDSVAVVP